ncbi:MAG: glycosyltransferase family 4 protein [Bacteroidia bacterium]
MNDSIVLLGSAITATAIATISLPAIIRTAHSRDLVDRPGGRKKHTQATPVLGGLAVFIAVFISLFFWMEKEAIEVLRFPLIGAMVLAGIGLRDDLVTLSARYKLLIQIGLGSLVAMGPLGLRQVHGIPFLETIPPGLDIVFTIGVVVLFTNAFNLIDGINGLAGGIGMIASATMAFACFQAGDMSFALLGFTISGALLGYLPFNFPHAKTFMGDNGSLLVGFLLSMMTLRLLGNPNIGMEGTSVIAIAAMFIPILDTCQVMLKRLKAGQSIFTPDRRHLHHQFLRITGSPGLSALMLCIIQLWVSLMSFYLAPIGVVVIIPLVFMLGLLLLGGLKLTKYIQETSDLRTYP